MIPGAGQEVAGGELHELAIDLVAPNPDQPRTHMDEEQISELSDSVKKVGILQPIIVRQVMDGYQIIAGERRWRAAKAAGLEKGSGEPNRNKVGKVSKQQVEEIAKTKMPDLNAASVESAAPCRTPSSCRR